jgi:hypothetical protein
MVRTERYQNVFFCEGSSESSIILTALCRVLIMAGMCTGHTNIAHVMGINFLL